jgi:hypothetical protein
VEENADAVQALVKSVTRHRAFPNARACLEAAQHALLLASAPDYDAAGARAWVFYLRRDLQMNTATDRLIASGATAQHTPEDLYSRARDEMVRTWNEYSSGKGMLIREAEAQIARQSRRPDNWAGVNVPKEIEIRLRKMGAASSPDPAWREPAELLRLVYSVLSRESHPHATRLQPTKIQGDKNRPLKVDFEPADREEQAASALDLTAGAVNLATSAVALRLRMGGRP